MASYVPGMALSDFLKLTCTNLNSGSFLQICSSASPPHRDRWHLSPSPSPIEPLMPETCKSSMTPFSSLPPPQIKLLIPVISPKRILHPPTFLHHHSPLLPEPPPMLAYVATSLISPSHLTPVPAERIPQPEARVIL